MRQQILVVLLNPAGKYIHITVVLPLVFGTFKPKLNKHRVMFCFGHVHSPIAAIFKIVVFAWYIVNENDLSTNVDISEVNC